MIMVIIVINSFLISGELVGFNEKIIRIHTKLSFKTNLALHFESKKIYNYLKGKENKNIILRGEFILDEDNKIWGLFVNEVFLDERNDYDKN